MNFDRDSHARAHLRMKACHTLLRYAWQETSHNFDEDDSLPKKMEEELFENVEPEKKYSHSPKQSKLQKVCHQQFEYRDGQIISYASPQLVLGVQGPNLRSGMEVVLVEKRADDGHQHWRHKEDSRTFHLVSNPDLVLAVSMTKAEDEVCGYPVIAQADLSSYEAENTLSYYEERLLSLRMKTCTQVVSHSGMAVTHQKAVKIIAYKNGDGYRNGKLIVAGTFPMLLAECTEQLGLARAASKVYTKDGTTILSLWDLVLWALDKSFIQRDSEEQKEEAAPVGTKETPVKSMEGTARMQVKTKLFPKSVTSDSLNDIDKSLLTLILRNPIAIWVSCGEPFLSPNALKKAEKIEKQNWLKKDKILADLDTMKHKLRQLKGRRVAACQPATMVPNKSPVQPVVVEGGWTKQTQEEIKLMDLIRHTELLSDCSSRLKLAHPARTLYTPDGEPIHSWDDIERDMVICVSTGRGFRTQRELKQLVEVRANYSRIRRQQGPQATDAVLSPSTKLQSLVPLHSEFLSDPS
ncbi:hypothetical protein J1605_002777 [Eschrichtius robustus]|uniref:DCDC1 second doublecortin-like domain-containing protein n=1 Tax=Eschrichtius robustus TaxID=9764 RepID=A0AB34HXZ0_ESCRO|nr:hypothetical protein J1605_002777 [Eschrichtius robustus]